MTEEVDVEQWLAENELECLSPFLALNNVSGSNFLNLSITEDIDKIIPASFQEDKDLFKLKYVEALCQRLKTSRSNKKHSTDSEQSNRTSKIFHKRPPLQSLENKIDEINILPLVNLQALKELQNVKDLYSPENQSLPLFKLLIPTLPGKMILYVYSKTNALERMRTELCKIASDNYMHQKLENSDHTVPFSNKSGEFVELQLELAQLFPLDKKILLTFEKSRTVKNAITGKTEQRLNSCGALYDAYDHRRGDLGFLKILNLNRKKDFF